MAAAAAALPSWSALEAALPAAAPPATPRLTLYRDTNGWCPFCERVWIALEAKGVAYDEVLIDLRNKPAWFLELVPTGLVPAIKHTDTGELVWESLDIMAKLEEWFPEAPPFASDIGAQAVGEAVVTAGAGWVYGANNASLTAAEKAGREDSFYAALDAMDAHLADAGPLLLGSHLTAPDAVVAPMLERWRYQLPLTVGFAIYDADRWPAIARWFDAMDAQPAYAGRCGGDAYSWAAASAVFLKIFSARPDGSLDEEKAAAAARGDAEAERLLAAALAAGVREPGSAAACAAASKLIGNRAAVVADASRADPKSQPDMARAVERGAAVDVALRATAATLLGVMPAPAAAAAAKETLGGEEETAAAAAGARVVAGRLSVPRDLGRDSAAACRAALGAVASGLGSGAQ